MNLLEYQAKRLLTDYGVPVPESWLARAGRPAPTAIAYPVVAKSQVPVGGRGKAGGILPVTSPDELPGIINNLTAIEIKGHIPRAILLEEQLVPTRELYLSLQLNRDSRRIEWLAAASGGVNIEDDPSAVRVVELERGTAELPGILGVASDTLTPTLTSIREAFTGADLLLLEINPLMELKNGHLIAADAKVIVDDNARFRHPELPWPVETENRPKPLGGSIGCIANGAGMAMSTMDTIVAAGGKPANFLDIGGGTGEKEFVTALRQIMELGGVDSIIINIFAGISRCDEIARGIIAAREQLSDVPPLYIRLEGTNRDIAVEILTEAGIPIEPDLRTCISKALEAKQ